MVERWEQRGFHQRGPVCGDLRVFGSYSLVPTHASRVYWWGKTDFILHAGADWLDGMALLAFADNVFGSLCIARGWNVVAILVCCIIAAAYLRLAPSESGMMWTFEVSATFCMMPINFVGLFPWAMSCWRPAPDLGSYYTYRRHKVADAGFCLLSSVPSKLFAACRNLHNI